MLLTLILSLSIHVVMLQVLRVPFPDFTGISKWAPLSNTALALFALIVVCGAAQPRLGRFSKGTQCIILFVLYAMLKESIRGILMNGVVTTGWGFALVSGLPSLTYAFVISSLTVFLTPMLRSLWAKMGGAAVLAGLATFAIRPALGILFAPMLKAVAHLDHPEVYAFPYGWHVLIPAYITYAEPVVACMCIAFLIWGRLSARSGLRMLQFSMLILLMRGMLLPTFIYSFYSKGNLPMAMLSESQFLFETLALAVLTTVVWQFSMTTQPSLRSN
ncbi:hypothetical protein ACPOL_6553 [Acidisarcina polymorpha]|uniref:Uncharacterized protein n=1 Tax=Acidisarcina polymorpha TaxID=2211140 RepID=A0A2Z5G945_9BACT|nr:hypothetical protein [Acidisarcina polymorpha]AXC15773.1 hypothetical protein ACPOL_6553 [Acidisarcina polymorpha]